MSEFINVGAIDADGNRFKSKSAIKAAIKFATTNGLDDNVMFDQTSMVQSGSIPGNAVLSDIPEGVQLVVVGPDPYTSRKWYANVERHGDKIVVK